MSVKVPASGAGPLRGTIRTIVPAADPRSRSFVLKVTLEEEPPVTSGMFARAEVPIGRAAAILIPPEAVVRKGQLTGLFVLGDGDIAKIEQWIAEGAKFDGLNERQELAQLKPPAKTEQAEGKPPAKTDQTPADDQTAAADDMTAAREKAALKTWESGMPGIQPARAETKHFLLLGNVSQPTLQQNGELAESLLAKVAEFFVASADEPLAKGRVTLFLLEKRSDYTQFGTLVEKRAPPAEWSGHWTHSTADAYGVSIVPAGGEYSMDALLVQQLAGLHAAGLGAVPRWFAEGAARAAAAKLKPDDARVQAWDQQVPAVAASFQRADDFQTGKAPPESADVASYSFVRLLLIDARRWRTLLEGVRSGKDFDATFAEAYGSSPSHVAEIWS